MKTSVVILTFLSLQLFSFAFGQNGYSIEMIGERFGKEGVRYKYVGQSQKKVFLIDEKPEYATIVSFDKESYNWSTWNLAELIHNASKQVGDYFVLGNRVVVTLFDNVYPPQKGEILSFKLGQEIECDRYPFDSPPIMIVREGLTKLIMIHETGSAEAPSYDVQQFDGDLEETKMYTLPDFPSSARKDVGHKLAYLDEGYDLYLDYYLKGVQNYKNRGNEYDMVIRRFSSKGSIQDYQIESTEGSYSPIIIRKLNSNTLGIAAYCWFDDGRGAISSLFLMVSLFDFLSGEKIASKVIRFDGENLEMEADSKCLNYRSTPIALIPTADGYLYGGMMLHQTLGKPKNHLQFCYFDKTLQRTWQQIIPFPISLKQLTENAHDNNPHTGYSMVQYPGGVSFIFEAIMEGENVDELRNPSNKHRSLSETELLKVSTLAWMNVSYFGEITYGRVKNAERPNYVLMHSATHTMDDSTLVVLANHLDGTYQFAKITAN